MKQLRAKETEDAPQSSTQRKSRCHRRAGGEDRGGGRGRHTWPLAGCENRGSRRGRQAWEGSPPANLTRSRGFVPNPIGCLGLTNPAATIHRRRRGTTNRRKRRRHRRPARPRKGGAVRALTEAPRPPSNWLQSRSRTQTTVRLVDGGELVVRAQATTDQSTDRKPARRQGRPDRPRQAALRGDLAHAQPRQTLRSQRRHRPPGRLTALKEMRQRSELQSPTEEAIER
jgi:hypothetical protein